MYKRIFSEKRLPSILYHATNKRNLKSILSKGIQTDSDGYVYLMEKPEVWNDIVFEVRIPDQRKLMDWRDVWYDDEGEKLYNYS